MRNSLACLCAYTEAAANLGAEAKILSDEWWGSDGNIHYFSFCFPNYFYFSLNHWAFSQRQSPEGVLKRLLIMFFSIYMLYFHTVLICAMQSIVSPVVITITEDHSPQMLVNANTEFVGLKLMSFCQQKENSEAVLSWIFSVAALTLASLRLSEEREKWEAIFSPIATMFCHR